MSSGRWAPDFLSLNLIPPKRKKAHVAGDENGYEGKAFAFSHKLRVIVNKMKGRLYQFIIDGSGSCTSSQDPPSPGEMWGNTKFGSEKSFGRVLHFQKCPWKAWASFSGS